MDRKDHPSQEVTQREALAAATPPGLSAAIPGADQPGAEIIGTASGAHRTRIGRFLIISELGRGGYGVVYRALDPTLGRSIAVKLLREECADGPARERLLREARAVARLGKHPNIVEVHDAGTTPDGQVYIAMELIEGESLEKIAARRPFSWREAGEIGRKVALGLEHAHRHGLIHRDVKPSNVLLDARGEPQITDFGVAKDLESGSASITRTGSAIGTPAFMSPEQAQGRPVDARSDVYGVGALLHALIRRRPPFAAPHVAMVLSMVIDTPPRRVRTRRNGCPRDLETIVLKAMEKPPARRYASAAELAEDLGRVLAGEPCLARRPGVLEQVVRAARSNPRNIVLAITVAAALVATYRYRQEKKVNDVLTRRERTLEEEEAVRERLSGVGTIVSLDERLKLCDETIRDYPGSWQPYYHRGYFEREAALAEVAANEEAALERYRAAEADLGRAIELNPEATNAYFWRGIVRDEGLDDHSGSERDFSRVLAAEPRGVLADIARIAGSAHPGEADLGTLDRAVEKFPRLMILRETRGAVRLLHGEHARALDDLEIVTRQAPLCGRAHAYRAMALAALGRPAEAAGSAERAIGLAPSAPYGYEARAIVRIAGGDDRGALADIDRALERVAPGDPSRKEDEELRAKLRARLGAPGG